MMHDLMVRPDGSDWLTIATGNAPRKAVCGLGPEGDADCGSWVAVPFFITFELLCFCLLLNAAIAVLLAHFQSDSEFRFIPQSQYDAFVYQWSKVDPTASRSAPALSLPTIVQSIEAPLGIAGNRKKSALYTCLQALSVEGEDGTPKLPVHSGGVITFHETLMELAARHFPVSAQSGGLGTTRFAQQHESQVAKAMRVSVTRGTTRGPTAKRHVAAAASMLGVTTPNRLGSAPSAASSTKLFGDGSDAPLSVISMHAASRVQAALQGKKARNQLRQAKTRGDLKVDSDAADASPADGKRPPIRLNAVQQQGPEPTKPTSSPFTSWRSGKSSPSSEGGATPKRKRGKSKDDPTYQIV